MATFTTTKDDGSQVEISLTKIGEDKATITVKERSTNKNPKKLSSEEMVSIVRHMKTFNDFLPPDASCLSPLGRELLEAGIMKETVAV